MSWENIRLTQTGRHSIKQSFYNSNDKMIKRKPKKGSKTTPDLSLLKKAMTSMQWEITNSILNQDIYIFCEKIIIINGACRLAGDSFQFKYNVNTHFEEYYKVH